MTQTLNELFNLKGKVAIVTGGGKGIGKGITLRLAEAGATVIIAEHDVVAAEETLKEINNNGKVIKTDVSKFSDINNAVKQTLDQYGKIDILINNAGIFPMSPFLDVSEELWDKVIDTNLKGSVLFAQAVAKEMKKQGNGGKIVNISSIDSLHPSGNLVHYDASKGGLSMATKSIALELAPYKINVNAIAPGAIKTPGASMVGKTPEEQEAIMKPFTDKIPWKRMGLPDDIATLTLFLSTSAADYITGQLFVVDGGYLLA
ncbi:MAG: SDR family oxidoreductase [bacterium]